MSCARYVHEERSSATRVWGQVHSRRVLHSELLRIRQCHPWQKTTVLSSESQIHTKWVCLWTDNNAGLEPYTMLDMSSLLCRDKNEPTKTLRPFCRNTLHGEAQHSRTPLGVHVVVASQDGGVHTRQTAGGMTVSSGTRTNRHSAILIIEALRLKLFCSGFGDDLHGHVRKVALLLGGGVF